MTINDLDPDVLEAEYKKLLLIILNYKDMDVVNYMNAMDELHKLEQKILNVGMLSVHSVVVVEGRKAEALVNSMNAVMKRFGR